MIRLETTPEGVILPVKAKAGARVNALQGVVAGSLKLCVSQSPERGKANDALIDLLANRLALRKSQIALVAGQTSPQKRFLIRGLSAADLSQRLDEALKG